MNENIVKEKYTLVCWLINRFDTSRSSISNRAAIVLSADAILLTANVLAIQQIIRFYELFSCSERIFMLIAILMVLVFLFISLITATVTIANVWKSSMQIFDKDISQRERLFYHPSATFLSYLHYDDFKNDFLAATEEQYLNYALTEYYTVIKTHHIRYKRLRLAIKCAVYSLCSFILLLIIILAHIFWLIIQ
ncbi:MAG: hypothetical protein H6Q17_1079 [Bacteroidetes bacterium]|nr:hypothetical protein [Bacteroidota bacterium]